MNKCKLKLKSNELTVVLNVEQYISYLFHFAMQKSKNEILKEKNINYWH